MCTNLLLCLITLVYKQKHRHSVKEGSARRTDLHLATHNTQRDIHTAGGIRTHNRSDLAAADPRLRQRYHLDLQC